MSHYFRYLLLTALVLSLPLPVMSSLPEPPDRMTQAPESGVADARVSLKESCVRFNDLNNRIRDSRIDRQEARTELARGLARIREEYRRAVAGTVRREEWVFPLEGYGPGALGGGRRHGYTARGYDFFSGNRHGGHPSFDIFIRDRNRDTLDDRSGRPVKVLSMTGGVVVALEGEWQPGSRLRGGKYLWVYDPAEDLLVYYAHNGELSVELGDLVKAGDPLGTVGRSGWNAAKRRSPTHLHLTALRVVDGGKPVPVDVYSGLKSARRFPAL